MASSLGKMLTTSARRLISPLRQAERKIQEGLSHRLHATMATSGRNRRLETEYKQHTAADDEAGVVLDVAVTAGQINEGGALTRRSHGRGDNRCRRADRHGRCGLHGPEGIGLRGADIHSQHLMPAVAIDRHRNDDRGRDDAPVLADLHP